MTFIVAQGVSLDIVEEGGLIPTNKVVIDDIQWGTGEAGTSYFLSWVAGAPVGSSKTWVSDVELVSVMDKYNKFREWLKCCICGTAIQPHMEWSPAFFDGGQSLVCSTECARYDDKPIELNSEDPLILRLKEVTKDEWMDTLEKAVNKSAELSYGIRGSDMLNEVMTMALSRVKAITESAGHNNEKGFATLYTEGFFLGMLFGRMIQE